VVAAAATFVLFRAAAWAIAAAARRVRGLRRPGLRLAFANMHRPGSPTGGIVMSLGIGLTVLVVITQVHGNFARELREQIPAIAPTFFFIDIQPDQVAAFDQIMRMPGVRHMQRVPSLRARITALNGVPVETARIQADVRWATGSDRGLTYSTTPPEGSRVVAGEWWPADYSGPPLISFDANLARGMGLGVGDTMTFNVLGVEIEARIANLRAIDWSSLGINFTTVFAPGALEGAPQTWLATASVAPEAEDEIERLVTEQLPNASTIRVRAALATIDAMLGTISDAAGLTAGPHPGRRHAGARGRDGGEPAPPHLRRGRAQGAGRPPARRGRGLPDRVRPDRARRRRGRERDRHRLRLRAVGHLSARALRLPAPDGDCRRGLRRAAGRRPRPRGHLARARAEIGAGAAQRLSEPVGRQPERGTLRGLGPNSAGRPLRIARARCQLIET
jgi:hypothetical protein